MNLIKCTFLLFNILCSFLCNSQDDDSLFPSDKVFTLVDVAPEFIEGEARRLIYLKDSLRYPQSAIKRKIEGWVYLSFIINKLGEVDSMTILKGMSFDCDKEAIRLVSLTKWSSGTIDGIAVNTRVNMPIKFELENKYKRKKCPFSYVLNYIVRPLAGLFR